jgi:hypothetical protein
MQSPPLEWTLAIGHLAVLDYVRARGEADRDTLSECVRDLIERHPGGRAVFTAVYAAGAVLLYRHICR